MAMTSTVASGSRKPLTDDLADEFVGADILQFGAGWALESYASKFAAGVGATARSPVAQVESCMALTAPILCIDLR